MMAPLITLNPRSSDDGLLFTCPVCNDHDVVVSFAPPSPFTREGEAVDVFTIKPGIVSNTCAFHGWVTHGQVRW